MFKQPYIVRVIDETAGGKILNEIIVSLEKELVTIRDIITARVISEVTEYNIKKPGYFSGLVQPSEAEKTLNGFKIPQKKLIDPEKQIYIALNAFLTNRYFILIDNKQATDLEEEVLITKNTIISFVKLTPLVGG